jgi:hypothetical protein
MLNPSFAHDGTKIQYVQLANMLATSLRKAIRRNERVRRNIRIMSYLNMSSIDFDISTYTHYHSTTIVDSIMLNHFRDSWLRPRELHLLSSSYPYTFFQIPNILLFGELRVSNKRLRSESGLEAHRYVVSIVNAFENSMFSANIWITWMHDGFIDKELDWICNHEVKER